MNEQQNSSRKQKRSMKTPLKNRSKTDLTVEKYLNAKLQYSQKRKVTSQRIIAAKQERIKQLQQQVLDNQQLVRQTLKKWQQFQTQTQSQKQHQLSLLQNKAKQLKQSYLNTQKNVNQKCEENRKLKQQNGFLKQKNKQLQDKYQRLLGLYKNQKKQWREIVEYVNIIVTGMSKMPPHLLQQYFQ